MYQRVMHDMVESPSPSPTFRATPLRSRRSTRSMLRMLRMPWRCGKRCKGSTAGGGANVFLWSLSNVGNVGRNNQKLLLDVFITNLDKFGLSQC